MSIHPQRGELSRPLSVSGHTVGDNTTTWHEQHNETDRQRRRIQKGMGVS